MQQNFLLKTLIYTAFLNIHTVIFMRKHLASMEWQLFQAIYVQYFWTMITTNINGLCVIIDHDLIYCSISESSLLKIMSMI